MQQAGRIWGVLVLAGIGLTGCIQTNELALAPNVIRLDTQASGRLFTGMAGDQTQRKAAEATLARGYTHYRLEQAQMGSGEQYAGTVNTGNGMLNGTTYGSSYAASYSGSSFSSPVYRPTANVGVTVVMFHADEPGAKGAFDAAEVMRQYKS